MASKGTQRMSSSPSRSSVIKQMVNKSKPTSNGTSTFHSKMVNVDQFKSAEFSSSLFIDNLTKGLVEEQAFGEEFEASSFKSLLDDSLEFLQHFAEETDSEIQSLIDQCSHAEKAFQMQIADLTHNFETNFSKFSKLDARINRVGSSAARIGDRLEVVDIQQKRANDAVGCIKYFLELNSSDSERSDVFTDPNKVHELAHLIKKLSGVAQELDLQSLSRGKMATEIISNNIENELLEQFEKADKEKDYDTMKEFANTLFEFNGGDSCIQRYITTRDMFLSEQSLNKDEALATDTSKRRLMGDVLVDSRLDEFYMDIVKTVEGDEDIIAQVFPSPPAVLSQLIQRIFEQRVRMFVELMLNIDKEDDPLLYLRTLCMALEKTRHNLVQALKKYWTLGVDFGTLVNSVFCNYQEEYIDQELHYVTNLFDETLHEIRTTPGPNESAADMSPMIIGIVMKFLNTIEEAVARAKVLSPEDQAALNVQRLFNTLIKYLGYDYLDDLLNSSRHFPTPTDPRFLAGLQSFFAMVATMTSSVLLIQRHFQLVTLPLVSSSVNEYTRCYELLGSFMAVLERKISDANMDKILLDQKKDDFKFKDEATEYSSDPTKTCQTCVKFIHNVYDTIIASLDGRNVEIFLEEFGMGVQKLLLNHFKKFKIGKGGLKLMRDLAEYKDSMKLFQIPAVEEASEILGEIAKLHLIAPENLKTVIEEGALSRVDKNEVLAFIRLRSDYKSTWIGKYV